MIFVTDADGQTIHTSDEWVGLTGQKLHDALGRGWLHCVHPEDRAIVTETLERAASQASEFSIRYRLMKPCGNYRWVSVGGVPSIGPPDRTFIGYLGSLTELPGGAIELAGAYGNVGRFVPPPAHPDTSALEPLDRIADHLIMAHALIEADGAKAALPGLEYALYEIGRALADRSRARHRLN